MCFHDEYLRYLKRLFLFVCDFVYFYLVWAINELKKTNLSVNWKNNKNFGFP